MIAKLWATEILSKDTIEEAKEEYNRVPRLLKEKVKNYSLMQVWRKSLKNDKAADHKQTLVNDLRFEVKTEIRGGD